MRWRCSALQDLSWSRRRLSTAVLTAPAYRRGQLVLHTASPPQDWPAKIADPIYTSVSALNIEGLGVAYAYDERVSSDRDGLEAFLFTPTAHKVPFAVNTSNLDQLQHWLKQPVQDQEQMMPLQRRIYVCTHGSRDCRCGEIGGLLYERLCTEVERRGLDTLKVYQCAHIGGHKFAGNAVVYPSGDWYGLLTPADAPRLIDIIKTSSKPLWTHWRGRTGLDEPHMRKLFEAEAKADTRNKVALQELGEQIKVCFERHDGTLLEVTGFEGESLMQVAKRHELVEATCACLQSRALITSDGGTGEGQCECATCAVDFSNFPARPASLSPPTEEELDQLEFSLFRTPTTRLACQVPLATLAQWLREGGRIKLPRY